MSLNSCLYCHKPINSNAKYCSISCQCSYRNGGMSRNFEIKKNDLLAFFGDTKLLKKCDVKEYCKNNKIPYHKSALFLRNNGFTLIESDPFETRHKRRRALINRKNKGFPLTNKTKTFSDDDINKVRALYNDGLSMRKIRKLGFLRSLVKFALKNKTRSRSEANKLAREKYPESYIVSDETRDKLRKATIAYLKSTTNETVFQRKNKGKLSYGESQLHDLFVKHHLYEKYDIVNEYCEYPYFMDFAFINEKVDVEYDSTFHFKYKKKIERDINRDKYLQNKGWRIFRIPYFELEQFDINKLIEFIGNPNEKKLNDGLVKYKELRLERHLQKEKQKERIKLKKIKEQKEQKDKFLNDIRLDVMKTDKTRGWITKLSKKWNISHTQVRRIIKILDFRGNNGE